MKIKLYVNNVSGQANGPGTSAKVVRLQSVPSVPANNGIAAKPTPNADIFKDGEGQIGLDLMNVTKEVQSQFEEGQVFVVDIRPAGPSD